MRHFAVLHFTKYKGKLGASGDYIDRLQGAHHINPDRGGLCKEYFPSLVFAAKQREKQRVPYGSVYAVKREAVATLIGSRDTRCLEQGAG